VSNKFQLIQGIDFIRKMCEDKRILHLDCTNSFYTNDSIKNDMLLHHDLKKVAKELYGLVNNVSVKLSPQSSDGVIAVCGIEQGVNFKYV